MEKHGFAPTRHETMLLFAQWMQRHPKQHHGMQSSPHHGSNKGGDSQWGLTTKHKCNVSDQVPKDGGDLTSFVT